MESDRTEADNKHDSRAKIVKDFHARPTMMRFWQKYATVMDESSTSAGFTGALR